MTTPDEPSLRRDDFREGVPIELANGQRWHFRPPTFADLYPVLDGDGNPQLRRGFDLGPGYDALCNGYVECEDAAAELGLLSVMAHRLLARNYTLEFDDMRYLLRIKLEGDPEVEANRAMWAALADVCLGNAPKTSAVGSS
jgi:hypothetical protein